MTKVDRGTWVLGSNGAKCGAPHFAPNLECNKIRSTVGERALGGDFIRIYSAFYSEARKVNKASSALNRVIALLAGANFCKARSLMAMSASI
jgi:hypothetical protein